MSETGQCWLCVPVQPAWAAGHFPGDPLMPGAKLLDEVIAALISAGVLQTGAISVMQSKFTAPVRPGAQLELNWRLTAGQIRFECSLDGQAVASGQLANSQ